ncbi:MAG: lipoyl synthase [Elusimicrobia bacterium]|nr:lipoyl synthase [Elusimicrobiota bacterium]
MATAPAVRTPLPSWLRIKAPSGENYSRIKTLLGEHGLNTVCEEARCPNIAECWGGGTATFMVMGDTCTRGCRFCSVASAVHPEPLNPEEPRRLSESLAALSLTYAVITTVCRDDLPDQGAGHIARCIREVKGKTPALLLEVLIGDFRGDAGCLKVVCEAGADVISHNIETVKRLTPSIRDKKAGYEQSLAVLRQIKTFNSRTTTKSALMLGLGETEEELEESFLDLRAAGVEVLTIGQYLRPSSAGRHIQVEEFVHPARFEKLEKKAQEMGFLYVASGPFVRSSYRAGELFLEGKLKKVLSFEL